MAYDTCEAKQGGQVRQRGSTVLREIEGLRWSSNQDCSAGPKQTGGPGYAARTRGHERGTTARGAERSKPRPGRSARTGTG